MADNRSTKSASSKRHNKLYRTPPTPPPEQFLKEEKGWVLDCTAVSSISCDYSKANPKLGPVIPPYNSQKDEHVKNYFGFHGVDKTLEKTGQVADELILTNRWSRPFNSDRTGFLKYKTKAFPGTSIDGRVMDYFEEKGAGYQYVHLRNEAGGGHSRELVDGHSQFMQGIKPAIGYNGSFGFRRNTPWLRQSPSPFGTASRSPAHEITVVSKTKTVQAK